MYDQCWLVGDWRVESFVGRMWSYGYSNSPAAEFKVQLFLNNDSWVQILAIQRSVSFSWGYPSAFGSRVWAGWSLQASWWHFGLKYHYAGTLIPTVPSRNSSTISFKSYSVPPPNSATPRKDSKIIQGPFGRIIADSLPEISSGHLNTYNSSSFPVLWLPIAIFHFHAWSFCLWKCWILEVVSVIALALA